MRRRYVWLGLGALVVAYLVWSGSRSTGPPTSPPITGPALTSAPSGPQASGGAAGSATRPADHGPVVLLLNAGRAKRQATLSASGFGLAPKERVKLTHESEDGRVATLASGRTDEHGGFGGLSFKIPDAWPDGVQTVKIGGVSTGPEASATFMLEASSPGAEPSTYFGKPMSPVSFAGGGFRPGEPVDVYFDSLAAAPLGQISADPSGMVHVKGIAVPPAAPGDHAFLLVGRASGSPVRVPFSVLAFTPWLALSDYTPQPERSVGVVGNDFAPSEHVAIFLGQPTGPPVAEGIADRKGIVTISSAFVVPYRQHGKLAVVAIGNVSQIAATATMTVRPYTPTFALTTYAGPPGTTVGLIGKGFGHGERLTIALGSTTSGGPGSPSLTTETDSAGAFRLARALRIPDRTGSGKITVTVIGEHSQVPAAVAFAVLPLVPWINPVPAAGPAGRTVAIDGGGFEPSEPVQVQVRDASPAPSKLVADQNGTLHRAGTVPIPRGVTRSVAIQAIGALSGAQATAVYVVTPG